MKGVFHNAIEFYASQSLRTISLAFRDLLPNEGGHEHNEIKDGDVLYTVEKTDYVLIAIIGIKDVIRPEVPSAVKIC